MLPKIPLLWSEETLQSLLQRRPCCLLQNSDFKWDPIPGLSFPPLLPSGKTVQQISYEDLRQGGITWGGVYNGLTQVSDEMNPIAKKTFHLGSVGASFPPFPSSRRGRKGNLRIMAWCRAQAALSFCRGAVCYHARWNDGQGIFLRILLASLKSPGPSIRGPEEGVGIWDCAVRGCWLLSAGPWQVRSRL